MLIPDISPAIQGRRLEEEIKRNGFKKSFFAEKGGFKLNYLNDLIAGRRSITPDKYSQMKEVSDKIDWVYVFVGLRQSEVLTHYELVEEPEVKYLPSGKESLGVIEKMENRVSRIELEIKRLGDQGDRLEPLLDEIRDLLRH